MIRRGTAGVCGPTIPGGCPGLWSADLETDFRGNRDLFYTDGGSCGNAAAYAKKLCAGKNMRYRGLALWLCRKIMWAMFATPDEAKCRAIIEEGEPSIAGLGERIRPPGGDFDGQRVSLAAGWKAGR